MSYRVKIWKYTDEMKYHDYIVFLADFLRTVENAMRQGKTMSGSTKISIEDYFIGIERIVKRKREGRIILDRI